MLRREEVHEFGVDEDGHPVILKSISVGSLPAAKYFGELVWGISGAQLIVASVSPFECVRDWCVSIEDGPDLEDLTSENFNEGYCSSRQH